MSMQSDETVDDRRPWISRSQLRLAGEFSLLFALAYGFAAVVLSDNNRTGPHPLWLPVVLLSLHYGTQAGVTAAIVASVLLLWEWLPPMNLAEDFYQYTLRLGAEPIGWTCVALLIGYMRDRQIKERSALQADLAEQQRQCLAVARLCDEQRTRMEMLERQIATSATWSASDIAEAIGNLHESDSTTIAERLGRFVFLMTGGTEFVIHLLRDDELKIAIAIEGNHRNAVEAALSSRHPLFEAVVCARRTLAAGRPADSPFLVNGDVVIGPLLDRNAPHRVIGMLRIGGATVLDFPSDIAGKFTLTAAEISRLPCLDTLAQSHEMSAKA